MTRETARRYVDAWTGGDRDGVRRLLADDMRAESNLDGESDLGSPERLVAALGRFADHLDGVSLVTETYAAGRAVLMCDCRVGNRADPIRVIDFLDIRADDGLIERIRRVYDVAALKRVLPGLSG
ncbi:SnoaL-like domain-containing protein [Planosporangium thailandense]|uniref:SnoaL-like domain-containing protein n=1 Tax=Planosporangium thailandense TaxID=765197 RepID=A0ABX0Y079_9ACTN|nr:nuclear transport factor 2 family protein [Planosporangium thailandense]NJC70804.1 SnoaL-like domain-containing protein [Planosporangium thailandense]